MTSAQRFRVAVALAGVTGWISLSQEILWVRVIGSAWRNSPMAFGTALGSFLVGVACGAFMAPTLQRRLGWTPLDYIATSLGAAGILFWLFPGLASVVHLRSGGAGLLTLHAAVAAVAACMGGILPIVARYGVADDANVGRRVGVIYFGNVVGATIGPLFTGFVLLEWLSTERAILFVGAAGILAAAATVFVSQAARWQWLGVSAAALALMTVGQASLYNGFAERLHFRTAVPEARYVYQASGRVGTVGVQASGELFGDGLYDGRYNVNPAEHSNAILRAYFLPVLQPNPRRVLEIGLGSGSWTSVMSSYPGVESLRVVEINPKYLDALRQYPDIARSIGPKVTVDIDDGRRWLQRHPAELFDAIVMNTSWHWRSGVTHLLSVEALREFRGHLAPGGVLYFNTTESRDAMRTAAAVFAHVVRYENFVAASDRVFEMSIERRLERLRRFPAFLDSTGASAMQPLLVQRLSDLGPDLRATDSLRIITEDNMASEFKSNWSGKWWRDLPGRAFVPERGWLHVLYP